MDRFSNSFGFDDNLSTFLAHYGVKGMKWGVINEDKTSGEHNSNSNLKEEVSRLRKERQAKGPEGAIKELVKVDSPKEDSKSGWRPSKTQLAAVAVGTLATAAIIYKLKTKKELNFPPHSLNDYLAEAGKVIEVPDSTKALAGVKLSPENYKGLVQHSWTRANNGLTRYNFDIPGTTIPSGHTFYRLSEEVETRYSTHTYMTPSYDDLTRYVSSFSEFHRGEGQVISFQSLVDIKTPDLKTRLDALHTVMSREAKRSVSAEDVFRQYQSLALTRFYSNEDLGQGLMKELRERGFGAMIDDNNVGIIGEAPMILFDSRLVGPKSSTSLSKDIVNSMLQNITEISNRR